MPVTERPIVARADPGSVSPCAEHSIERTGQFRRDYKREARGRHRTTLDADLVPVLAVLAEDQPLEPRRHDHTLSADWKDHRDCHVKP